MEESPAHEKGRDGWFRLSLLCEGAGVGEEGKEEAKAFACSHSNYLYFT